MEESTDSLSNDLRVKLSEKEDDILNYLAKEMKISKSVIARLALRDFFIAEEHKLSTVEMLHERAKDGHKSGMQRRLLGHLNKVQQDIDDLRAGINDI